MAPVMEFSVSDPSIGLIVRPPRSGPEANLTSRFISSEAEMLCKKQRSYAVFMEPQLDTGFPDIVVATFNPRVFEGWIRDRSRVAPVDLKVLHHLHFIKGADSEEIEGQLGMDSKTLVRSLERLLSAGLVRWSSKQWMPRSLKTSYAITNIQAIEVKINNWGNALDQAELNRWFASESYVLSPICNPSDKVVKVSQARGVGIYTMPLGRAPKRLTRAIRSELPVCYASWLFNEWIGRRLAG